MDDTGISGYTNSEVCIQMMDTFWQLNTSATNFLYGRSETSLIQWNI